jgi:putative addiction module component (TIGR02574 family)
MTVDEVKTLPIAQKLKIMEAIWEDLRERFDNLEISEEQKSLLDQRRLNVRKGTAQLLDWDSVKGSIGKP